MFASNFLPANQAQANASHGDMDSCGVDMPAHSVTTNESATTFKNVSSARPGLLANWTRHAISVQQGLPSEATVGQSTASDKFFYFEVM